MKAFYLIFCVIFVLTSLAPDAHARRRKKKFKGIIVVNQILKLDGTMTVNGKPALEFSGVKEGDFLETQDHSYAVIRIPGLAIFRLNANTGFKLTKFANRDESRFELVRGEVLSLFKRLGTHEVNLPHTKVTLHSTIFSSVVGPGDKFEEVKLEDGKIDVENRYTPIAYDEPAPSPLPQALPSARPSPLSRAEIKALPDNVVIPHATPPPQPVVQPSPWLKEITITTQLKHSKTVHISQQGFDMIEEKFPSEEDARLVSDLESLYDLP